jgi:hypothetical protein
METEYSDGERYTNYKFLENTIRHVRNQERITEDWMEDHKSRIVKYREFWHDMSRLNPEIKEYWFRALAVEAETLLTLLYEEILETKTFTVESYHAFNECVYKMAQTFLEEEDLAEMFSCAAISK